MTTWTLDEQGYVCHWLVAGPALEEGPDASAANIPAPRAGRPGEAAPEGARDQFSLEIALRSRIAAPADLPPEALRVDPAVPGRLGLPWRFMGGRDGAFVNLSDFYARPCRVRFDAMTRVLAPADMTLDAVIWSYAAAAVYLNGAYVGGIDAPAYKPIRRSALRLSLRAGENAIYVACEALGVRDTRSVAALQFPSGGEALRVSPPGAEGVAPALALLEGARPDGDGLRLPSPAPAGTRLRLAGGFEPDYAKAVLPPAWTDVSGLTALPLPPDAPWATLEVPTPLGPLARRFERTERILPQYTRPVPDIGANRLLIQRRIAAVESLNRGGFGFPLSNILARKAVGLSTEKDDALLEETLELIDRRVDCADFMVCALVRYLREYPVSDALAARVRAVLLNWRYWMDMEGSDGMCFWSENHALMFYSCAMFCGGMYPDDRFPRAGMTGRELSAWGRKRVLEWLDDVERWGFEEFLSAVYMCVTFAALINLIDYAEPEISARAARLTDGLLERLALHTWKGGFIAPMGRVYRGALYPFSQGVMALMNLIDPAQPYDFGEGWLGFYATSKYRPPEGLAEKMAAPASLSYVTGNARIVLEKREDWCLTSVAIPREPFERWPREGLEADSHGAVKAWNERFHGTTRFVPGGWGYQQHLWYAALDGAAVAFVNHPGAASEEGDMRPGYWHGNGVFPALRQQGGTLGMIYRIPQAHPLRYVHAYFPKCRFDAFRRQGNWLLAGKGRGYIGLWLSAPVRPWSGVNFDCEWRAYGDDVAGLCVCGGREFESLDAFAVHCRGLSPEYKDGVLAAGAFRMEYAPGEDDTQYL